MKLTMNKNLADLKRQFITSICMCSKSLPPTTPFLPRTCRFEQQSIQGLIDTQGNSCQSRLKIVELTAPSQRYPSMTTNPFLYLHSFAVANANKLQSKAYESASIS
jgi:hypothetical protein